MKSVYEIAHPNQEPSKAGFHRASLSRRRLSWIFVAALAAVVGLLAWASFTSRAATAYNTHNLIRLHVVANSNQADDQAVKLEVRDAILNASGGLFSGDLSSQNAPADAAQTIQDNLPLFRQVAENVLRQNGYDYPVDVEYGTYAFPEKAYGPLVLPAGDYQALRVVLGSGRGANWWCILFPPLCYLDVVGKPQADWGVNAQGDLAAGSGSGSGKAPGSGGPRVVSLNDLSEDELLDVQTILGRALNQVDTESAGGGSATGTGSSGAGSAATDSGVKIILSDIPSSPDTDLVILVADTGSNRTEVRFFVFDRLRDFIRSLAEAAPPWLLESLSPGRPGATE